MSGSMAGSRIEASLAGLDYMFNEVFQPTDYLGTMTYNGELNTLHLPMRVDTIDRSRDKEAIRQGLSEPTHVRPDVRCHRCFHRGSATDD